MLKSFLLFAQKRECFQLFLKTVGLNIKKIEHQNGLTQAQLVKKDGIVPLSLYKNEKGLYGVKLQTLFNSVSVLNIQLIRVLMDKDTLFLDKGHLSFLLNTKE